MSSTERFLPPEIASLIAIDLKPTPRLGAMSSGLPSLVQLFSAAAMEGDKDIALILNGLARATKVAFPGSKFGSHGFQSLSRHFECLTELNLSDCDSVTSTMIQEALCSCHNLEVIDADFIQVKDVVGGRPWVCLSLRELKVCFLFHGLENDLQPLVFERLSRLTQLETLEVGYAKRRLVPHVEEGLVFRLHSGLAALAILKRLKFVDVYNLRLVLGANELEWMKTNWTSLVSISGEVFIEPGVRGKVEFDFFVSDRKAPSIIDILEAE
ncbi:hypothetical protein BGX27_011406 [Mortierella sp. AM989]|nr:hypothetical protein BGX27_011406 [Mortierella sp. AM989]